MRVPSSVELEGTQGPAGGTAAPQRVRGDRRAPGQAQEVTRPWSRARFRVSQTVMWRRCRRTSGLSRRHGRDRRGVRGPRVGRPTRSVAEPGELLGVALPVLGDLDVQVEVDARSQYLLELGAGAGADVAEHRAAATEDDRLLAAPLDEQAGADHQEVAALLGPGAPLRAAELARPAGLLGPGALAGPSPLPGLSGLLGSAGLPGTDGHLVGRAHLLDHHRDRMRQLLADQRDRLLADHLGDEVALRLVGHLTLG